VPLTLCHVKSRSILPDSKKTGMKKMESINPSRGWKIIKSLRLRVVVLWPKCSALGAN
jgi:hypothetical protein